MNTTSSLNQYWLERGEHYRENDGYRLSKAWYREQARFVVETLRELNPMAILELGCGYGRITREVALSLPDCKILATDLSVSQLEAAAQYCAGLTNLRFEQRDLYQHQHNFSGVVLAVELFLHLPLKLIRNVIASLRPAKLLHDFDQAVKPGDRTGHHCFAHDYPALYRSLGLECDARVNGEHGLMLVSQC